MSQGSKRDQDLQQFLQGLRGLRSQKHAWWVDMPSQVPTPAHPQAVPILANCVSPQPIDTCPQAN